MTVFKRFLDRLLEKRQQAGLLVLIVVVGLGIWYGLTYQPNLTGPIEREVDNGVDLTSKISQTDLGGARLLNSLTDNSQTVCFESFSQNCASSADDPVELTRTPGGPILTSSFFRYQGEINYTQTTPGGDAWQAVSSLGMNSSTQPDHDVAYSIWNSVDTANQPTICVGTLRVSNPGMEECNRDTTYNTTTFDTTTNRQLGHVTGGVVYQGRDLTTSSFYNYNDGSATNPNCSIGGNVYSDVIPFNGGIESVGPFDGYPCEDQGFYSVAVYHNDLFVGTRNIPFSGSPVGAQIWRQSGDIASQYTSNTLNWSRVVNGGFNSRNNVTVYHMFVFNDKLFASVINETATAHLLVFNGSSWSRLALTGSPIGSYVTSSALFGGKMYVNVHDDGAYWTSDGVTWNRLNACGGNAMAATATTLFCTGSNGVYRTNDGTTFTLSITTSALGVVENSTIWSLGTIGERVLAGSGTWSPPVNNNPPSVAHDARVWCLGCSSSSPPEPAKLTLTLPPKLVFRPDQLLFNGVTFSFNYSNSPPAVTSSPSGSPYTVTVAELDQGDGDARGRYYQITLSGFAKQSTSYPYRLKLLETVTANDLATLGAYLSERGNKPNVFVDGPFCGAPGGSEFVCFITNSSVKVPELTNSLDIPLRSKIAIPGIVVEGNVSAPGLLKDFSIQAHSLAVGGTVTVAGGTPTSSYLNGQTTFAWNNVEGQLNQQFQTGLDSGSSVESSALVGTNYNGTSWYLNSSTKDPTSTSRNSFSSPPEGKIWRVAGGLNLNNPIDFSGAGTIVVDGSLTINAPLNCITDTRLAFLVKGAITINTNQVGCGAFLALGGSIRFSNAASGRVTGIFIAKSNIDLPDKTTLNGAYLINYDSQLASNPTALLKEALSVVYSTSS